MSKLMDHALSIAAKGYDVFPVEPGEKRPKYGLTEWQKQAATNENIIMQWWSERPDYNIGLHCKDMVAIDVDPDGMDWYIAQDWPEGVPTQTTPRGGRHLLFKLPAGQVLSNRVGTLAKGVDVKTTGGYIVTAPSQVGGKPYEWVEGLELPEKDKLPEPPEWLLTALIEMQNNSGAKSQSGPEQAAGNIVQLDKIPKGQRNSFLYRRACLMRSWGWSGAAIYQAVAAENREKSDPPLSQGEVQTLVGSAMKHDPDQAKVCAFEGHHEILQQQAQADLEDEDEPSGEKWPDPGPLPSKCYDVPGIIGSITEWSNQTGWRAHPELSLAAALACFSVITGRKITDPFDGRPNLYLIGLGETGIGKDHGRRIARRILKYFLPIQLEAPEDFASDTGLLMYLKEHGVALSQIDEIGKVLSKLKTSPSAHHQGIITDLTRLFSSANTTYYGKAYADTSRNIIIEQPFLSLYGTTVEDRLYEGLTVDHVRDGFLPRFLFFEADQNQGLSAKKSIQKIPQYIVNTLEWWKNFWPGGNLAGMNGSPPTPQVIPYTDEAMEYFTNKLHYWTKQVRDSEKMARGMLARINEKACKMAMLYAASRNYNDMIIDIQALEWGFMLVEHLTLRTLNRFKYWLTEGGNDEKCKFFLRLINEAGPAGITKTGIARRSKKYRTAERSETLQQLIEGGDIRLEEKPRQGQGRPKTVYYINRRGQK